MLDAFEAVLRTMKFTFPDNDKLYHPYVTKQKTHNPTYNQVLCDIGVDLGVEILVFSGSVLMLKRIYPEFNAGRILRGLLRMHWVEMMMLSLAAWCGNLFYQNTYGGVDMSMRFDWIRCRDAENSTWIGGFKWKC